MISSLARQGKYFFDTMVAQSGFAGHNLANYFATRTKFLDDVLLDAIKNQNVSQVVIAGCGGDARAYRLPLPSAISIFEVDFPEVIDYRKIVLKDAQSKCHVAAVACDLSKPSWSTALLNSGYVPQKKSLWILEGLLMYLTIDEISNFVTSISALSGPGSIIAGDHQNTAALVSPYSEPFRKVWYDFGHPMVSGIDNPEAFFPPFGQTSFIISVYLS
jgi:methyltransferase (TIGR00027 family)